MFSNPSYANCYLIATFLTSSDFHLHIPETSQFKGMTAIYLDVKFHDHKTITAAEISIEKRRTVLFPMVYD